MEAPLGDGNTAKAPSWQSLEWQLVCHLPEFPSVKTVSRGFFHVRNNLYGSALQEKARCGHFPMERREAEKRIYG